LLLDFRAIDSYIHGEFCLCKQNRCKNRLLPLSRIEVMHLPRQFSLEKKPQPKKHESAEHEITGPNKAAPNVGAFASAPHQLKAQKESNNVATAAPKGRAETPPQFKLASGLPMQRKEASSKAQAGAGGQAGANGGLPQQVKAQMEGAFGANFDDVKIVANSSKASAAGALAFAQGNTVHFASGQYNPESKGGQELLGHELAHVVQQRQGRVQANAEVNGMAVNNQEHLEKEADQMGAMAANFKGQGSPAAKSGGGASDGPIQAKFDPKAEKNAKQEDSLDEDKNNRIFALKGKKQSPTEAQDPNAETQEKSPQEKSKKEGKTAPEHDELENKLALGKRKKDSIEADEERKEAKVDPKIATRKKAEADKGAGANGGAGANSAGNTTQNPAAKADSPAGDHKNQPEKQPGAEPAKADAAHPEKDGAKGGKAPAKKGKAGKKAKSAKKGKKGSKTQAKGKQGKDSSAKKRQGKGGAATEKLKGGQSEKDMGDFGASQEPPQLALMPLEMAKGLPKEQFVKDNGDGSAIVMGVGAKEEAPAKAAPSGAPAQMAPDPKKRAKAKRGKDAAGKRIQKVPKDVSSKIAKGKQKSAKSAVDDFKTKSTAKLAPLKALESTIAPKINAKATSAKAKVKSSMAASKLAINADIAAKKTAAQTEADRLYGAIEAQHDAILTKIKGKTVSEKARLKAAYDKSETTISKIQSDAIAAANKAFSEAQKGARQAGKDECEAVDQRIRSLSAGFADPEEKVVSAMRTAAQDTGEGFKKKITEAAEGAANEIPKGKAAYLKGIADKIKEAKVKTKGFYDQGITKIDSSERTAIQGATQNLQTQKTAAQKLLASTLQGLDTLKTSQTKAVDDAGNEICADIDTAASKSTQALKQQLQKAASGMKSLISKTASKASKQKNPDTAALKKMLAGVTANIVKSVGETTSSINTGVTGAGKSLMDLGNTSEKSLADIAKNAAKLSQEKIQTQAKSGAGIEKASQKAFDATYTTHENSSKSAVDGMSGEIDKICKDTTAGFKTAEEGLNAKFKANLADLKRDLKSIAKDLDAQVKKNADEAAAKAREPWWKTALKILITVVVAIVVTALIVAFCPLTLGGLLLAFAIGAAGAVVGLLLKDAVDGKMHSLKEYAIEAVAGGIGGVFTVLGGPLANKIAGAAGGLFAKAAVQTAIKFGVNVIVGTITDTIGSGIIKIARNMATGEEVSWNVFFQEMKDTALTNFLGNLGGGILGEWIGRTKLGSTIAGWMRRGGGKETAEAIVKTETKEVTEAVVKTETKEVTEATIKNEAREVTETVAGNQVKKTGKQLADELGYPKAPDGYNWSNINGKPVLKRNPGKGPSAGDGQLPKLEYDPKTGTFRTPNGKGSTGKGPEIRSGAKEDPFDFYMNGKTGEMTPKQNDLMRRIEAKDELGFGLTKIGKREVTPSDLVALTNATGKEHAIIMTKDGQRVLVRMADYNGGTLPSFADKLLMHSHPNDGGSGVAKWVSPEDILAIKALNQKYSYIVTADGSVYRFTQKTVPNQQGELIRELRAAGFVPAKE
jgi:uncharacterized membrane protein